MILKFGSKGNAVVTLQRQLAGFGYKGKSGKVLSIDGIFGESTEYAVIQFQQKLDLWQMVKSVTKPVKHWQERT